MFHMPIPMRSFFPSTAFNERYEELAAHPDWGFHGSHYSKDELLSQRDRVVLRAICPTRPFVAAHHGREPENLTYLDRLLFHLPECFVDHECQDCELGRQPYTAASFFLKNMPTESCSAPI